MRGVPPRERPRHPQVLLLLLLMMRLVLGREEKRGPRRGRRRGDVACTRFLPRLPRSRAGRPTPPEGLLLLQLLSEWLRGVGRLAGVGRRAPGGQSP